MKFGRRRPTQRRSPRLRSPEQAPVPTAFRVDRPEPAREPGRQVSSEGLASSAKRFGLFWLQRVGLLVLVIAVLASVVNILSLSSEAKIVPLSTINSQAVLQSKATYAQAANSVLASSVWNRNKITVNTGQISRQLLKRFPELNSASVTIPLLAHQPVVYIEPVQPGIILVASNGAFVIGNTGKAILSAAAPADFNQPKLPVVTDQSSFQAKLNQQALAGTSVRFVQTVVAQLAAKQYTVSGLVLPASTSELDVQLAGQPYMVKFNLQSNDPRGEAGTFLATMAQLHRQNVTPTSYVDVRVDGRAYYK